MSRLPPFVSKSITSSTFCLKKCLSHVSSILAALSDEQVIKHAGAVVKSRAVPPEVLSYWQKRISQFEPEVAQVIAEEAEEKVGKKRPKKRRKKDPKKKEKKGKTRAHSEPEKRHSPPPSKNEDTSRVGV